MRVPLRQADARKRKRAVEENGNECVTALTTNWDQRYMSRVGCQRRAALTTVLVTRTWELIPHTSQRSASNDHFSPFKRIKTTLHRYRPTPCPTEATSRSLPPAQERQKYDAVGGKEPSISLSASVACAIWATMPKISLSRLKLSMWS